MKVLAAVCVAVVAGSVSAAVPSQCTSGQGKKDYDAGKRFADSTFTTSWNFLKQV
jgi:hypothetical protein